MKFTKLFPVLMALAMMATFAACDKDPKPEEDGNGMLDFHFEYKVGAQDFSLGQTYTIGGTAVVFDVASFYIGGIVLKDHAGTETQIDGKYLLVNPTESHYEVASIKKGQYQSVNFFIGVDALTNEQTTEDFTSRPASDPLAIQHPAMHWNWNSGYRFLRIDGRVDADGDGTPETLMAFHLGTNALLRDLAFTTQSDLTKDHNKMEFTFDLAKLFEGVDLTTDNSTHTSNNRALANQVADNLSIAITKK